MSITSFRNDPARLRKEYEISTATGRYMLNMPGQGTSLPFMEDPNVRLQQWGANLHTNSTQIESELFGMTRHLNRDIPELNSHKNPMSTTLSYQSTYRTEQPFVEESRATHPAWMYRDIDLQRWEMPWINPQSVGIEQPFSWNLHTRILEKDYFTPTQKMNSRF